MKQKSIEIFIPGPSGRLEGKYFKNTKKINATLWLDKLINQLEKKQREFDYEYI